MAKSFLGVALARWEEHAWQPLHVEPLAQETPQHDDLARCIERCCNASSVQPRQLRVIAVSAGPGGFTSVRIAIVTAKIMAEVTGAICIPVPTCHALAAQHAHLLKNAVAAPFGVALASKGADTFLTVFDADAQPVRQGTLCDAARLITLVERSQITALIADRFLPPAMLEQATLLGLRIFEPAFHPLAVLAAAVRCQPVDPIHLMPIYPREPEAVTKWRAMRH